MISSKKIEGKRIFKEQLNKSIAVRGIVVCKEFSPPDWPHTEFTRLFLWDESLKDSLTRGEFEEARKIMLGPDLTIGDFKSMTPEKRAPLIELTSSP